MKLSKKKYGTIAVLKACPCYILVFLVSFWFISNSVLAQIGFTQYGFASYYHNKFHGRRTSSGERFSQYKFTAAHRKLPFNTMVRVTNIKNDKSVIVRINDRGPYKYEGRIIDLSWVAARQLGVLYGGLTKVKIEVVGFGGKLNQNYRNELFPGSFEPGKIYNFRGQIRNPKGYGIQVAAFFELVNAVHYGEVLYKEGFKKVFIKVDKDAISGNMMYKVKVGEFESKIKALEYIPMLKKKDFIGFPSEF